MNTGIVILAAGGSSRLGRPKQLLVYQEKTLLQHVIEEAMAGAPGQVLVVLGGYAEELQQHIPAGIMSVVNDDWQHGLSSSIAIGVRTMLAANPQLNNIILTVADQPFTDRILFSKLIEQHTVTGKGIIASKYADTAGTPALFSIAYFEPLLKLNGKEGAKKMFDLFKTDLETVTFEDGAIDIDTEEHYTNLITRRGI